MNTELRTALGDFDRMPLVYPISRNIDMAFSRLLIAADPMASHHQTGAFADYRKALQDFVTERIDLSVCVIRRLGNFDWVQTNPEMPNWIEKPTATSDAAASIAAELAAEAVA